MSSGHCIGMEEHITPKVLWAIVVEYLSLQIAIITISFYESYLVNICYISYMSGNSLDRISTVSPADLCGQL